MEPIQVRAYPVASSFPTMEKAIAHARSHPRLADARRDAERLAGSRFVDAAWTLSEWILRFDNDLSLRVWLERSEVRWTLAPSEEVPTGDGYQRVGAAPVVLDWGGTTGLRSMDASALVACRRGARFKTLFVNEMAFLVYFHEHLILWFGQVERLSDGQAIIYVCEED